MPRSGSIVRFAYKPLSTKAFATTEVKRPWLGFFRPWLGMADFQVPIMILASDEIQPDPMSLDAIAINYDFKAVGEDLWGGMRQVHSEMDQDTREKALLEIELHGKKKSQQKKSEQESLSCSTS